MCVCVWGVCVCVCVCGCGWVWGVGVVVSHRMSVLVHKGAFFMHKFIVK